MRKLHRRYQILPAYAYCRDEKCTWTDSGKNRGPQPVEDEAQAHAMAAGHEVRCVNGREVIISPLVQVAAS